MALADAYDTIVFDCDGVLWSGGATIPGAYDTLQALRAGGAKIYFMSNNSSRGAAAFRAVFARHGLEEFVADDRYVWNSVTATRRWFAERSDISKAYVVGCEALRAAVRSPRG